MQDLYCSLTLNYWNIPHQNISFLIYQENLTICGDVLLQDNFTVWDPKQLIKKGRERHIFLFEMCLLFAKEMKDNNGKSKYMYKFKLLVSRIFYFLFCHDDVIKWKHLARYWPFVRGIHRSLVNSPHKGQWCGALMLSSICAWMNGWVNSLVAGDLRRRRAHYDVTVMVLDFPGRNHLFRYE